jgi:hypothetical protein
MLKVQKGLLLGTDNLKRLTFRISFFVNVAMEELLDKIQKARPR